MLHCVDDVFFCKSYIFNRLFIVKFFIKLVASNTSQVVAADTKEHSCKVTFCSLNSNRLARHQDSVNLRKTLFLCRLIRCRRTFLREHNFFTLKAVHNHFAVQRRIFFLFVVRAFFHVELYYIDFLDSVYNKIVNIMRMKLVSCAEQLFFFTGFFIFYDYRFSKNSSCKLIAFF